jgi:hypothetical protein
MTKLKEELSLKEKLQILKDRADNQIDWEAEKEKWLVSVAKLYQTIEKWLEELVTEDYVQITQKTITVSEDQAGIYQIPQLEMAYGDKVAVLEPIAVDMPFAKGMIEFYLKGDKREGYALLLWKDDEDHDDWKFYNERALGPKIRPFNQALFEETLEKWLTQFLW